MKKSIAILMSLLLFSTVFFSMPASAYSKPFDITDYTIADFQDMEPNERKDLLYKFIDTYNPYGIKEKNAKSYNTVQPLWKSDGGEGNGATHEMITMQAFLCFVNDYGFYNVDGTEALTVILLLSAASGLPDKDEIGIFPFSGHFYDPDTQKNWAGSKTNTAKTNAQKHFTNAYNKLKTNVNMSVTSDDFKYVLEELGRSLHYIQDANEPHHANNQIAVFSNHSEYEKYVDERLNNYIGGIESTFSAYYTTARNVTVAEYTHKAATVAKPIYENIKDNNKAYWDDCTELTIMFATFCSAGVIYKLFEACGASFTK